MIPETLRRQVLVAARTSQSPTRAATRLRARLQLVAAFGAMLAVLWLYGGVRPYQRPTLLIGATALGALGAAAAACFVALGRGGSMLGRRRGVLVATSILVPLVLLAWKLGISAAFDGMMVEWPERVGFRCLGLSLASGLAPLIAFLALRRASDPLKPATAGAAIGAAAGACAWIVVDLWCPVAFPRHLLVGHVLPVLLFILAGTLAGRALLAPRSAK